MSNDELMMILSQTGNDINKSPKFIKQKFGKYIITIELSIDNKFLGIYEVEEDKKYLDVEKRKLVPQYLDVSEYYED